MTTSSSILFNENYEKLFPAVYRGIVVDTADPINKGRVRLKVPQVTGDALTSWAWPVLGSHATGKSPYGSWTSEQTQTASTLDAYTISINTLEESYDIELNGYTGELQVGHTGTYNIQFSAQVYQPTNDAPNVDIWIQVNGVNVDASAGRVTTSNQIHYVLPSWNYVITLNSGDKVKFKWQTSIAGTQLVASLPSAPRPSIPSFAVTMSMVDKWLPNPGEGVWVMYEGGDPNYPLWVGAF